MMKNFAIATTIMALLDSGRVEAQMLGASTPGPHLLVYKTRSDYRQLVPVLLSADKKTIVSYPDPSDIRRGGKRILPGELKEGYLVDNRGIGMNVAFLNITYKKYAKLKEPPSQEKMMRMIKDADPLTALCDCGLKANFKEPVKEVNVMIDKNELPKRCEVMVWSPKKK